MIDKLRKKLIMICTLSFFAVFFVLFSIIYLISTLQTNRSLDALTDIISANQGRFPKESPVLPDQSAHFPKGRLDEEAPFRTRFFCVRLNSDGNVIFVDTQSISSIDRAQAITYAYDALKDNRERGWVKEYRYKIYDTAPGREILFVNGTVERASSRSFLMTTLSVFGFGGLLVLLLTTMISKWAVKPAAESYARQKQFITDANHELKTPLTLIHTNLEIMQAEHISSEWLTDIHDEVHHMIDLVNHLVTLARMDEEEKTPEITDFDLSRAVDETADLFSSSITGTGKRLSTHIPDSITYRGNEDSVRQLVSILIDNAVKYCDDGGLIRVALLDGRHPCITVDNSYQAVGQLELDRLFDRFYRADKARTRGGFGIGLSLAKAITEKHRGTITAQNLGDNMIRFCVKL